MLISQMCLAETRLPATFRNRQQNRIDNAQFLNRFFDKVQDSLTTSLKVMMVGDSHVRGNVFPNVLKEKLQEQWDVQFSTVCKNGIQLPWLMDPSQMNVILSTKPDLLIVSVGTNEAHSPFSGERYKELMQQFVDRINEGTDSSTVILFTSSPGSHKKDYKMIHGDSILIKTPNPVNKNVADAQKEFCSQNGYAFWNLYEISGALAAPRNWRVANLMKQDAVHFTKEGYTLQATLLFEALFDAFNKYKEQR